MAVLYLAPPVLFIIGIAISQPALWLTAAAAYAVLSLLYVPTLRLYQRPLISAVTLPLAGLLYTLMTLSSAFRHWRGRGGNWKGRSYPSVPSF